MTEEIWTQICTGVIGSVGKNNFETWIKPIKFINSENGVLKLGVKTKFQGDWVSRNYVDQIKTQALSYGLVVERVKFVVQGQSPINSEKRSDKSSEIRSKEKKEYKLGAPLDQRFTFDRFVVGKPNELAHAAARRVSVGDSAAFNPLFLYGGVGLGKTHLMHSIAIELKQLSPDLKVV